jgi:TolB-like protein/DNA-binding winged helix-turn-helix (wHTH) protein/Tfp pilus assembly protein PilF
MVGVWSAHVLVLIVQLSEFGGVAGSSGTYSFDPKQLVIDCRHGRKPAMEATARNHRTRFGAFDVDLRSGELHKHGIRLKLQDQPFQVLALLMEHSGDLVTREELRHKLWPADTFVDFDNGLNSAINKLRDVLGDSAEEPRYIETLPRRGYRFIARIENGSQPALPAGEESHFAPTLPAEEAVSKETRAAESAATRRATAPQRRRIQIGLVAMTAFVLLVFGLNLGGWRNRLLGRPAPESIRSIAVLPLQNLTGDPGQDYFVDGMHEELVAKLGSISALRVISRTTMMKYKQTKMSLPEIARELKVDAVLEGSVRRSETQVWITAQLIHASADRHLWTKTYQRTVLEVPLLQGDVARAIAQEIESKLTPQEKVRLAQDRPVNPEAYEAYLRGRFFLAKFTSDGFDKAAAYFEMAIEKDPNYAAAFASLSHSYSLRGFGGSLRGREAMLPAEAAARKALALDETLAEAHAALAIVKYRYQWDWQGAESEFRHAIELNPNSAEGLGSYSTFLRLLGRCSEALPLARDAHALDPVSRIVNADLTEVLYCAGRYEDVADQLKKILEADPQDDHAHRLLGRMQLAKGQAREAIVSLEQAASLSKRSADSLSALGYAYGVTGKRAQALQILRELETQSRRRYVSPIYMARVHVGLGNNQQALAWLERAYEERNFQLVGIYRWPYFEPLHSQPQFQDLLKRMGLPKSD